MSLKDKGQALVYSLINPLIKVLLKIGVTPNHITFVGLLINMAAAVIFIYGAEFASRTDLSYVGWAGFTILVAGLFDMIDGRLARLGNMSSSYGAFYDSVLDRYSELIMFLGICYYLIAHDYFISSLLAFVAMIGSIMISYTRARAESLGVDCSIGWMQRPERVIIIGASAMFCGIVASFTGGDYILYKTNLLPYNGLQIISIFTIPITFVALFSNLTALKRLRHSKEQLIEKDKQAI